VVLESVAAIFVARSFFDNVIGLEKIVGTRTRELDQRTRDMALVFDNVGQGFVTMTADGVMSAERSTILRTWLGEAPASGRFADYVAGVDADFAQRFELGASEVFAGIMPVELTLDQLPKQLEAGARHLHLDYRPIGGDVPDGVLIVVSDITAELERERGEAERRELMAVFERLGADRRGFFEFCNEADGLVRQIATSDAASGELARQLHTLKGNAAIFGVESIASCCHALETQLLEDGTLPTAQDRAVLVGRWQAFTARLEALTGPRDAHRVEITDEDIQRVLAALQRSEPAADIVKLISAWRLEPIARRFERAAEQANRLARRLGKAIHVEVADHGLRIDPQRWAPFWSTFVHAVRNTIDHGIEDTGEREESGKPETARIKLTSMVVAGVLRIEIRDDGRGVNWDRVRERAARLGLPCETRDELVEALFTDGLSTKDEVTELSGRGVGLSALQAVTASAGGSVTVASEPHRGTSIRFEFPLEPIVDPAAPAEGPLRPRARNMTM